MKGWFNRVIRLLRSARLAIFLLVSLTVYSWVATLVPDVAGDAEELASWVAAHPFGSEVASFLGLYDAFASPLFLALAALLIASTIVCSWDRTRVAVHSYKSLGVASSGFVERIRTNPDILVEGPGSAHVDDAVEAALRSMHLRTRRGSTLIEGRSGTLGLWGSPLFHWSLVLLMATVALGQLTKHEGGINLVMGQPKSEVESSYSGSVAGPLFGEAFTGHDIVFTDLDPEYTIDGVYRGFAPYVVLSRDGEVLAEQWTYPNNALRYGSLMLFPEEMGPALVVELTDSDGASQQQELFFTTSDELGIEPMVLQLETASGSYQVLLEAREGQRIAATVAMDGVVGVEQLVSAMEPVALPEGATLTPLEFTQWVQLTIVNDWSIPYIYAAFVLAALGALLTLAVPPRRVWVTKRVDTGDTCIRVRARRSDPAFRLRLEERIRNRIAVDAERRVSP